MRRRDDNLRQPPHRHPRVPFGVDDEPPQGGVRAGAQPRVQDHGPPHRPDQAQRGLHHLHEQGPQAHGPAPQGDCWDGPHDTVPHHADPVRQGHRARGPVQGRRKRRLRGDRRQDLQGQDGVEVRSGDPEPGDISGVPSQEVRDDVQGGLQVDRPLRVQLRGRLRQADQAGGVRDHPQGVAGGAGRLRQDGIRDRPRPRHHPELLLRGQGPLGP